MKKQGAKPIDQAPFELHENKIRANISAFG